MSYRNFEIFKRSFSGFLEVHEFSRTLPKYELYELGSQLRRSADSVNSNIVEGYGRKKYKKDYIRFLIFSHSSCDETIIHLEKICHLYPELSEKSKKLITDYIILSKMISNFISRVSVG